MEDHIKYGLRNIKNVVEIIRDGNYASVELIPDIWTVIEGSGSSWVVELYQNQNEEIAKVTTSVKDPSGKTISPFPDLQTVYICLSKDFKSYEIKNPSTNPNPLALRIENSDSVEILLPGSEERIPSDLSVDILNVRDMDFDPSYNMPKFVDLTPIDNMPKFVVRYDSQRYSETIIRVSGPKIQIV